MAEKKEEKEERNRRGWDCEEMGYFTEYHCGRWLIALGKRIRNVPKNTTFDLERLMGENSKLLKTKNNLRTNFTDNW